MQALRIKAHLDGTGIIIDPTTPIHLDGVLAAVAARRRGLVECFPYDQEPEEFDLPLVRVNRSGTWHWAASVFELEGEHESLQYARRHFDISRAELLAGTVRYDVGPLKETRRPWPLILAERATAWCVGDGEEIEDLLGEIRRLGRERGRGKGGVTRWLVEATDEDFSCIRNEKAMRYLPDTKGWRMVRPRPPYWHPMGAVNCLTAGEAA